MFDANEFSRVDEGTGKLDSEGTHLVAEASELRRPVGSAPTQRFLLDNCPEEGMHRSFHFVKCDMSGGDVAGWNYEEDAGPNVGCLPFTLLIIND